MGIVANHLTREQALTNLASDVAESHADTSKSDQMAREMARTKITVIHDQIHGFEQSIREQRDEIAMWQMKVGALEDQVDCFEDSIREKRDELLMWELILRRTPSP